MSRAIANSNVPPAGQGEDLAKLWKTVVSSRLPAFEASAAVARTADEHWTAYNRGIHVWGRVAGIEHLLREKAPLEHARLAAEIAVIVQRISELATRAAQMVLADKANSAPLFKHLLRSGRLPELEAACNGDLPTPAPIFPGQPPGLSRK